MGKIVKHLDERFGQITDRVVKVAVEAAMGKVPYPKSVGELATLIEVPQDELQQYIEDLYKPVP